jgi:cytochrome d ubiquinol oxidase subunit I
VNVVHLAFQSMVAVGLGLLALSAWYAFVWWRRRRPPESPWFWRAAVLAGPAAVVALEAGWVTTEVGRQPWIVYGILRTREAVNPAPGLWLGLVAVVLVYAALTGATVYVLRRLARDRPVPLAPQEADVEEFRVT